jgi:hypothetical protein
MGDGETVEEIEEEMKESGDRDVGKRGVNMRERDEGKCESMRRRDEGKCGAWGEREKKWRSMKEKDEGKRGYEGEG